MNERPSWDSYFLTIARAVAKRSTCDRARVGAVLVRDKRILSTGYNGTPRGLPHCTEVGCIMVNNSCQRVVHAEANVIIQAALHGVSTKGATLYVTHQPCLTCAKTIINAGIVRVVYAGEYPDDMAQEFLSQAGVVLERYEKGENKPMRSLLASLLRCAESDLDLLLGLEVSSWPHVVRRAREGAVTNWECLLYFAIVQIVVGATRSGLCNWQIRASRTAPIVKWVGTEEDRPNLAQWEKLQRRLGGLLQ